MSGTLKTKVFLFYIHNHFLKISRQSSRMIMILRATIGTFISVKWSWIIKSCFSILNFSVFTFIKCPTGAVLLAKWFQHWTSKEWAILFHQVILTSFGIFLLLAAFQAFFGCKVTTYCGYLVSTGARQLIHWKSKRSNQFFHIQCNWFKTYQ